MKRPAKATRMRGGSGETIEATRDDLGAGLPDLFENPEAKALEVFAGGAVLTRALNAKGVACNAMDVMIGGHKHDISRREVVEALKAKQDRP